MDGNGIADSLDLMLLSPTDKVGIAVTGHLERGRLLRPGVPAGDPIRLSDDIPIGHKVCVTPIRAGETVRKAGYPIGTATRNIGAGEHVHTHNLAFSGDLGADASLWKPERGRTENDGADLPLTFNGWSRADGTVGIRNYILVLSSVNCSATVARRIVSHFLDKDLGARGIHGVVPAVYGFGCATAMKGFNYETLLATLAGWAAHVNVVGVLAVGLGCETLNPRAVLSHPDYPLGGKPALTLSVQEAGGTRKAVERGIEAIGGIIEAMGPLSRMMAPVSHIRLALNCGGSDAFSGLTANPALGFASDALVKSGGTSVLGETPECHGTEAFLKSRCRDAALAARLGSIFDWWDRYLDLHHVNQNDNISLGNMEGGISTILEKSMGAVSKGGFSPINQVLNYAQRITSHGFAFMDTPGFDPVSVTGLVAGGCNIVAFTTGRGSTYGCSIAPTIKISSNSGIFVKMPEDMDMDAGPILRGTPIGKTGGEIYRKIIRTANGETTASEANAMGWDEFVPWVVGETL